MCKTRRSARLSHFAIHQPDAFKKAVAITKRTVAVGKHRLQRICYASVEIDEGHWSKIIETGNRNIKLFLQKCKKKGQIAPQKAQL